MRNNRDCGKGAYCAPDAALVEFKPEGLVCVSPGTEDFSNINSTPYTW